MVTENEKVPEEQSKETIEDMPWDLVEQVNKPDESKPASESESDTDAIEAEFEEITDDLMPDVDTAMVKRGLSLTEIKQIGDVAVKSNRFPAIFNSEQAVVSILSGREIGLGPMKSLQELYVIEGKVAMSSGLIASLIKGSGKYEFTITTHDSNECVIEFTRHDKPAGVSSFSMDDAKQAGLVRQGSGWTKYPRNMLFARALTNGARWFCADAFAGPVYTPDELEVDVENPSAEKKLTGTGGRPVAGEYKWFMPDGSLELGDELCPIHWNHKPTIDDNRGKPVYFFKRGNMRGYAHPVAGESTWCDWHRLLTRYRQQVVDLMERHNISPTDRRSVGEGLMTEIAHIATANWRIVDWWELCDRFDDEYEGEPDAQ